MTTDVTLALGSNLGDRLANLRAAVAALRREGLQVYAASSVWKTEPVPAGQPAFLNAVLRARCPHSAKELLAIAKAVERELGRQPGPRWGPRTIDIDILFYGHAKISEPDLLVPHPLIAERVFVLAPLAEVWSEPLPLLGVRAEELLASLETAAAVRLSVPLLPQAADGGSTDV